MAAPRWRPAGGREEVERAIAASGSVREAASRLGVHDHTLRRWCAEHGVDLSGLAERGRARGRTWPVTEDGGRLERDVAMDRLKAERDEYRRLYQEATRRIREQEDVAAALAEAFVRPRERPRLPAAPRRRQGHRPERHAVLLLSDWQLGQVVRRDDTGGLNTYDWDTAAARLRRWVEAAAGNIEMMRSSCEVREVTLAFLGDMVEGHDVFSGQAWSLDKDAALQALDGAALFADAVTELVGRLWPVELRVYCVPGNHGKPGGRRGGATPPTFSFDYLFYRLLQKELADLPVAEWGIEPCGRLLFMCAGVPVLMTHGDEVRGWGGFPYYGLDKAHGRLLQELETVFHLWLLGHWHQSATLPAGRGRRVVNGSAVGANRLTTAAVLGADQPSQTLLYISRDLGLAEEAYLVLDQDTRGAPSLYGAAGPTGGGGDEPAP